MISALRRQAEAALPAILVSGDTSPAVQGLKLDARLRITSKPVQAERLLALIGELIEAQRTGGEAMSSRARGADAPE